MVLSRAVVACLLVLGLCGCAGARRAADAPSRSPSDSTAPSSPTPVPTTHDNLVATRKFSAWLLHAVPMPRDAHERRASPTAHYRHGSLGIGPSDPKLGRTTWWTVPLSRDALRSWLRSHAPRGLHADYDAGNAVESRGVWEQDLDFHAASTLVHTEGWVNFAFMAYGSGVVVRVDTFVGARFARTVRVPGDTTSVTIRRTERSVTRHPRPHTTVRTITGIGDVARLVAMVNALPGSMTTPFNGSCPASLSQLSYTMTFSTPHDEYVASLPTTTCWPQLTLAKGGVRTDPTLDPGQRFVKTADRYLN